MTAAASRRGTTFPPPPSTAPTPPRPTRWALPGGPNWEPANALVAGYLAAAAIPLVVAVALGRTPASWLAAHALFLATTAWCARHPARAGTDGAAVLAPWLPLLLVPPLYTELPHVAAGLGAAMHDARVIGWELALFGDSPARTFAARAPWRWLSETLHAGYLSYYAVIYGPPLLLFARRRRPVNVASGARPFAECAFTVMLAFVCCYAAFVVFPVQGPWFEWPAPAVPDGPVRRAVERLLHAGSSRGTAFPSSHVAVSVAQTLVTLRHARWAGLACAACTTALALGAMYGGLHYGIDVVAGAALGAVVGLAGPRVFRSIA